jgi:hypothetical protein
LASLYAYTLGANILQNWDAPRLPDRYDKDA